MLTDPLSMPPVRRRTVVTSVSTAALSAVAGCTDFLSQESDGEQGTDANRSEPVTDVAMSFVNDLADARFESALKRFAPSVREEIGVGQLEQIWLGYTAVGGAFDGIAATEETVMSGHDTIDVTMAFDHGEHGLRLVFDAESRIFEFAFNDAYERPTYVDPSAVDERDIDLETDECSLGGTVTTPSNGDNVPGVVLVHGSGKANRDVQQVATRMFKDLADGLATQGIATLRYDKRTHTCEVAPADHTLDRVTVDDALVAIERLRTVDGVDGDRIVVAGHSMGGMAAPRIADRDGNLAGVAGLAAPARPFHEMVLDQLEHQATVGDRTWEGMSERYEEWSDDVARIRDGDYDPDEIIVGLPGALWASLESYDHIEVAGKLDAPLLFLQGDRDYQVTVEDDLELWRSELGDRSVPEFKTYDGLNHLLMPGEGPAVVFESFVRNNVAERVVDDFVGWIDDV